MILMQHGEKSSAIIFETFKLSLSTADILFFLEFVTYMNFSPAVKLSGYPPRKTVFIVSFFAVSITYKFLSIILMTYSLFLR